MLKQACQYLHEKPLRHMRHPIIQFCNTSKNGKSQERQIDDIVSVAKTQNLECKNYSFMEIKYFSTLFIERE